MKEEGRKGGTKGVAESATPLGDDLPPRKTDSELAKLADTSERGIRQSAYIAENAPEPQVVCLFSGVNLCKVTGALDTLSDVPSGTPDIGVNLCKVTGALDTVNALENAQNVSNSVQFSRQNCLHGARL